MQHIFEVFLSHEIFNVNIWHQKGNETQVEIYTSYPFRNNSCSKVNIFSQAFNMHSIQGSNLKNFSFGSKFKNFHGCPLRVTPVMFGRELLDIRDKLHQVVDIDGLEGQLLKIIAKRLNFDPKYVTVDGKERHGFLIKNRTMNGGIGKLWRNETDILIGFYLQRQDFSEYFDFSMSYADVHSCFASSYGRKLTFVERVFAPLKNYIWLLVLILCFMFVSFLTISQTYFKMVVNIWMNIELFIRVLLGIDVYARPEGRTLRATLSFISVLLIFMRTSYFAKLFDFIVNDVHMDAIDTIDDAIAANSTIYIRPYGAKFFPAEHKINLLRNVLIPNECWESYIKYRIEKGYFKDVFIHFRQYPSATLRMSKQNLLTSSQSIYFQKYSYLTNQFNKIIMQILSNGLVQKFVYKNDEPAVTARQATIIQFKDMKELFLLYFLSLTIPTAVFILEIVYFHLSKKLWVKNIIRKFKRMRRTVRKRRNVMKIESHFQINKVRFRCN